MPLPACTCVTGAPIGEQLAAIYCALYDISVNGATVNLENITGISDFWKATLGGTPAADQVFGTDGAGVFTTFDVSDAGQNLLSIATPVADSFIIAGSDGTIGVQGLGQSGNFDPVTSITTVNGLVTDAT